ncbi:hypothetical protein A5784_07280 [Mycobacterium sp. 852013-50091_SCH5140682]|uniref:Rv3235 family protein n=1 Tax=Mycobacterium sp. 852013-50091_SCH5140682 TaxID=1834109 RepID=UPI0007EB4BA9|nr:Rv3235 family protein [Mycobacterium sp. 852013-50091_SCH5140682]OBC08432.1 hypothetical protein A5784_07280 [Mycobacterium sp. 852013-50091_SCH5140682]
MPVPETTPAPPSLTSPVIDFEPPAYPLTPLSTAVSRAKSCPAPTALHRPNPRRLRLVEQADHPPQTESTQFAEAVLRRVLEVIDRRRPPAQLRPLISPQVLDAVLALPARQAAAATLRRVRLRAAPGPGAAEVFATFTRGPRVHAIAAKIELHGGRWQLTALQVG